ncbi:hypothetical protein [Streptomyces sp. NBC_00557]|uniref:hypothetical protein n=1 Tax=Streptomyces sp. NBC_00557 TaxID=2975776 RepID=UPI002E80F992|nr:hypothetical protein [Streptomyces sp. NBC_00557]WUC39268.1 hypothetical protein OG956_36075 [Streptomyces sp. NBC_00557]
MIAAKGDLRIAGDRLVHYAGPAWLGKGVEAGAVALAELVAHGPIPHRRVVIALSVLAGWVFAANEHRSLGHKPASRADGTRASPPAHFAGTTAPAAKTRSWSMRLLRLSDNEYGPASIHDVASRFP